MTTYNASAVSDAVIDYKKGITLQQGRALRDNPIALAEGATGAPYDHHVWHPYNGVLNNDGITGEIWSFATNGAVATITSPDFVDGYEYRFRFVAVGGSGATQAVRVNFYRETSAAYAGVYAIGGQFNVSTTLLMTGRLEVYRPRQSLRFHEHHAFASTDLTDSAGTSANVQTSLVRHATIQKLLRAQFSPTLGNFATGGAVYMDKRRCYV